MAQMDDLVKNSGNSIANALELQQTCAKPSNNVTVLTGRQLYISYHKI